MKVKRNKRLNINRKSFFLIEKRENQSKESKKFKNNKDKSKGIKQKKRKIRELNIRNSK